MKIKIKIPTSESVFAFLRACGHGISVFFGYLYRILKWPVLVAIPLIIFALAAWWSLHWSLSGDVRTVPDLIDLTAQEAQQKLSLRSLRLEVEEQKRHSDLYAEGHILEQEPKAGSQIKLGRHVKVTLSAGFRRVLVPSLINMSLREAQLVAEQKGFKVRRGLIAYCEDVPEGSVIAQSPQPSTPFITEFIDVLESRGPRPKLVMLPRLEGRPLLPVLDFLRSEGVSVVVWARGSTQDISNGDRFELRHYVIYRQSPEAGEFITIPGSVDVILRVRWNGS